MLEYKKWEPAPKAELPEELTDCVGLVMAFIDIQEDLENNNETHVYLDGSDA